MSENAVTMAGNQFTAVTRRVLREPFTARAWRTFLYCFCQPFVDLFGLIVVVLVVLASTASAALLALPLIPPTLGFARWLGSVHRAMGTRLLDVTVPDPSRAPRKPGWFGFISYHFGDPVGWRAIAFLGVKLIFSFEFVVGVAFRLLLPLEIVGAVGSDFERGQIPLAVVSFILFFAAPKLTELCIEFDVYLMRRLLGPSEDSLRIRELEQTRSNAINEAAATLRRIERDLHDGAQARLVALGMRLGRAERQFERGNGETAMELLRESRAETKEIIQELRDLVRGIHPPALDSGLQPALATLAAMTPVPTSVRVLQARRQSAAVETMLYFAAAELLTNAAKHSGARSVSVTVVGDEGSGAQLIVTDDGRGGATLDAAGSGLRGLAERVRAVDGRLTLDSPPGGPTTVTVTLPPARNAGAVGGGGDGSITADGAGAPGGGMNGPSGPAGRDAAQSGAGVPQDPPAAEEGR
jgi:signal transduction histidine kinase